MIATCERERLFTFHPNVSVLFMSHFCLSRWSAMNGKEFKRAQRDHNTSFKRAGREVDGRIDIELLKTFSDVLRMNSRWHLRRWLGLPYYRRSIRRRRGEGKCTQKRVNGSDVCITLCVNTYIYKNRFEEKKEGGGGGGKWKQVRTGGGGGVIRITAEMAKDGRRG